MYCTNVGFQECVQYLFDIQVVDSGIQWHVNFNRFNQYFIDQVQYIHIQYKYMYLSV